MNRVGLTDGLITTMDQMGSQRGPPERAAREGRQIQRTTLQNWDKTELQIGNTQRKQAYISNPS